MITQLNSNRPLRVLIPERRSFNLNSQSVYVRVVEPMKWLEKRGYVEFAIASEFDNNAICMLKWADIVIFNKHSSDNAFRLATVAKNLNKKIIYDVDDNIFNVPRNLNVFSRNPIESSRIIELADVIVVENKYLYKVLQEYHTTIEIIPNAINFEIYGNKPHIPTRHQEKICLFSSYVPSLNKFIHTFIEVINKIRFINKNIRFDLYGNNSMNLPVHRVIPPSGFADFMLSIVSASPHMGIVPIWGDEDPSSLAYRDCKSPIKYIMYGLAGIPTVYTNVTPYKGHVTNEETGLLVDNNFESWIEAMERICKDVHLRNKIIKNAYYDIKNNFDMKESALKYYHILKSC